VIVRQEHQQQQRLNKMETNTFTTEEKKELNEFWEKFGARNPEAYKAIQACRDELIKEPSKMVPYIRLAKTMAFALPVAQFMECIYKTAYPNPDIGMRIVNAWGGLCLLYASYLIVKRFFE
jgi:hypothetical protein